MKKLKGPDLKTPELKVPALVADVYYDLRDRRLLPLVGFVLVAIVAVPFLVSASPEESGPKAVEPPAGASVNASKLTVVEATPGLRDYRRRLQSRTPKDPFKAPGGKPSGSSAKLGSKGDNGFESNEVTSTATTTTTTAGTTTETTETTKDKNGTVTTETETKTESGDSGSPQQPGGSPDVTLFAFAIDVRVKKTTTAADGSTKSEDPETRSRVISPAPLPGQKTQVVTYGGINPKTKNALFLVSDEVSSIFGEATCLSGDQTCQLLEVEAGIPTTFVYGPGGARYKITVLKIYPVTAGKF